MMRQQLFKPQQPQKARPAIAPILTSSSPPIFSGKQDPPKPNFQGLSQALSCPIQAKLTIGQPNDKYEKEADQVAEQVVKHNQGKPENSDQQLPKLTPWQGSALQTKTMGKDEPSVSSHLEASINQTRGTGSTISGPLRSNMESSFGADFRNVRIHTNNLSDQLNRSINAKAFTTGKDIFFRQGEYQPQSQSGQKLLAHELTHVVQQTNCQSQPIQTKKDILIQRDNHNLPSPNPQLMQERKVKAIASTFRLIERKDAVVTDDMVWKFKTAMNGAVGMVDEAIRALSDPRDLRIHAALIASFGRNACDEKIFSKTVQTAKANFQAIRAGITTDNFPIVNVNSSVPDDKLGYVTPKSFFVKSTGDKPFDTPLFGIGRVHIRFTLNTDDTMNTIIHEASHKFNRSRDNKYLIKGSQDAMSAMLAMLRDPETTDQTLRNFGIIKNVATGLNNADSYPSFAWTCSMGYLS